MKAKVPGQHSGKQMDLKASRSFKSAEKTLDLYHTVRHRLLHPDSWDEITRVPGTEFKLVDSSGRQLQRGLREGDYLRINIPGPGSPSGEGYDWVQVDNVTEEASGKEAMISVTLRPAPNPKNDDPEVAHFFTGLASSTLSAEARNREVITRYSGRNEHINEKNENLSDKIRNIIVGMLAKAGASKVQWQQLIERLLEEEDQTPGKESIPDA